MTSHFDLRCGHVLELLRGIPDGSVHCAVTSPPYWGLRDYGTPPQVWGGDPTCNHKWGDHIPGSTRGGSGTPTDKNNRGESYGSAAARGAYCQFCGAWRGSLGLEPTHTLFIEHLVNVFEEVRRVLKDDGTLWLNLGDSYASDDKWGGRTGGKHVPDLHGTRVGRGRRTTGLKPKDLVGIPWRVAFALQDAGWWLRADIIWHKRNPMPESIKDRPTKAHEYIFLLAKQARYYYDADAIREPHVTDSNVRDKSKPGLYAECLLDPVGVGPREYNHPLGRNKRSVWSLTTIPTPEAHFATFPIDLAETCILAGSPASGVVLDPFSGAGTTGLAALKQGRNYLGLELNPEYIAISRARARKYYPLLVGGDGDAA